jgi:hypothetical protein
MASRQRLAGGLSLTFRADVDRAAVDNIRLALDQSQPLGNARFHAKASKMNV